MKMKIKMPSVRKPSYGLMALIVAIAAVVPALTNSKAYAYAQLTERSVTLGTATPSATAVTYEVSFKPATTGNIRAVVIDFCGNSPVVGYSSCTAVTGLTIGTTVGTVVGLNGTGSWTAAIANTTQLTVSNSNGGSVTAGTLVKIPVSGFVNPSAANSTFYARIVTYAGTSDYTTANVGSAIDAGGAAMSTSTELNVSGTVAESLTFCTSLVAPTGTCSGLQTPTLDLGTGTPKVLGTTVTTGTLYSQLSTNAANGATIRMRVANTCGTLVRSATSPCTEIAPVGASAAVATGGKFGMRVTGGSGISAVAPYNSGTDYAMDATTALENVTTSAGDAVASATTVVDAVNTTYTFAASASNTTPAGVYAAKISLIAVGSY